MTIAQPGLEELESASLDQVFPVWLEGVGKKYRLGAEDRWVLRNVDFQARSRECVFLIGPSGSGKSTLLSIIGCILTPDEGDVIVAGNLVSKQSCEEQSILRRTTIGFVFQKFQLIRGLSAAENVAVPLTLQGLNLSDAMQRSEDMLERVGLKDFCRVSPTRLSLGQCQRVAIARAVVTRPKLVLADEPTASLDGATGREAMEILTEVVREQGACTIVVTHDSRIYDFADRILTVTSSGVQEYEDRRREPTAKNRQGTIGK